MSKANRRGFEFSNRTKEEERSRWHAKNPGRERESLQVHHILPISEGKKRGVPRESIRSQQNAVAVPKEFHKRIHRKTTPETYDALAEAFKKLWMALPLGGAIAVIAYLATLYKP